ncbi:berberine bridge enzyme-like 6 [Diospyros lotus]|uniref:berberine bridge enzyme-like 6 n=1 Tax=Diospyros lotus TaxID=55363 RepID=UPI00224E6A76|nr:berberine bridge enzyme-like 6 [Diospyros lotus]
MLPLLISALLFSISSASATSHTSSHDFVQCLKNLGAAAQSPIPISESVFTIADNPAEFELVYLSYFRNGRFHKDSTQPLVIVVAMHESHVQQTVICAKKLGLHLRVRSGGHDDEGLSYIAHEPFVLLDMFKFQSVDLDINAGTGWVQSGASLGELYHNISQKSTAHAFPGGLCPSVCTGGHFLGGGFGVLMRKYGLSIDHIIDACIVDANGKILDRAAMGEDLFWAIRGGGTGFGVLLSWKIELVSVPSTVTFFRLEKTLAEGANDLVYKWQEIASELPDDIFLRLEMKFKSGEASPSPNDLIFQFIGLYLGQAATLQPLMEKQFPELGLRQKDCKEMTWAQSTLVIEPSANVHSLPDLLNRQEMNAPSFKVKSDFVKTPIPKSALDGIWIKMTELNRDLIWQWNPYGGRMSQISESATPFPHRTGYKYLMQYWYMVRLGDGKQEAMDKLKGFYNFMAPYVTSSPREGFVNYRDLDLGTNENSAGSEAFGASYFMGNFERLRQIKTKFDPDNFFRTEQSIPPLSAA